MADSGTMKLWGKEIRSLLAAYLDAAYLDAAIAIVLVKAIWRCEDEGSLAFVPLLAGAAFLAGGARLLVWALIGRKDRRAHWQEGLWKLIWAVELAGLPLALRSNFHSMGIARLCLFMVGVYLQSKGLGRVIETVRTRPLRGGTDLTIGLIAAGAALLPA